MLRVGVRRREGRPGGRGSWVGQVLSPKGRPWIRPGAVVALRLARHGHLQAPMPSVLTRLRPWGVAGSGSSRRRRRLCRCRARALTAPVGGFDSLPTEPSVAARRRAKRRREGPLRGHDCGDVARLQSAVHQSPLQADDHGAIDAVLWRWKVAQKIAMLAFSNVAERGIDSRGHALVMGPSHCDYWL